MFSKIETIKNIEELHWFTIILTIVYTVAVIENTYGYNLRMKRRLSELASSENAQFLKKHLRLPKVPKLIDFAPLPLSALIIAFFQYAIKNDGEVLVSLAVLSVVGLCLLTITTLIAFFHLVATFFAPDWYEVDKEIRVKNFLTTKQLNFLLKNVDKKKRWLSTFGAEEMAHEKEIWSPDKLVPLLKRKDDMDKLIELSEAYESLNRKGSEYSFDQLERKTKLSARLLKGYLNLSPQVSELIEASSHNEREEAFDKDGEEIQGESDRGNLVSADKFDRVEQHILSALESLETAKTVKTEGREPVRELERVVNSTSISEETRKQASSLLEQIQSMNEKEAEERGREIEEMDALAVIQANKQFYGVDEETR